MPFRMPAVLLAVGLLIALSAPSAHAEVYWENQVRFSELMTKDIVKLLPRSMGAFIYQNRLGFMRGLTFMTRSIQFNTMKLKDLEEIRREAYERLSRDIPYCVEAFKGGEIKLDTSASNLAGRLGMIGYSIFLQKLPAFPDLEYLETFTRTFYTAVAENLFDLWVFYDGYGDFHSLGELMERLKQEGMPQFKYVRNEKYPVQYSEDVFAMFRAPNKFEEKMVFTDVDMNDIYNSMVNDILDAYVYIWKCSGMDLAHPSYAAPPGTVIQRPSKRREIRGGILARTVRRVAPPRPPEVVEEAPAEQPPGIPEEEALPPEQPPAPTPPPQVRPPVVPPPEVPTETPVPPLGR
jgi:hypothetical protein